MMEICEVRDECPYDTSIVVMEDCVNKNMDEIHRYITEHDIETNWYSMKMAMEEFPDGQDDDEKKKHQRIKTKV